MEYIDLRELIKKTVSGDVQINKAIMLTSRDRTETSMVTFLNHLMKYNKIKKEDLFTFYFKLINIFNKVFGGLMRSQIFNSYIQHVKKEWEHDDFILYKEDVEVDNSKKTIEELLENMNVLCRQFRELNNSVKTNNMNDVIVEDDMMDSMDSFLNKIRELSGEMGDITSLLDKISENIDKLRMDILLDLSMKDKSIYLMFSGIDDDLKIPGNVNIIFLNYIYIINLIKKHIVYFRRIISKVTTISGNMSKYVEDTKDTVKSKDNLFHLNKQQTSIDDYLEGLDEYRLDESDMESVISEPYETGPQGEESEEPEESLLDKLSNKLSIKPDNELPEQDSSSFVEPDLQV